MGPGTLKKKQCHTHHGLKTIFSLLKDDAMTCLLTVQTTGIFDKGHLFCHFSLPAQSHKYG